MITMKIKNAGAITKAYTQIPQIMNERMKDALEKSASLVENSAKRKSPVNLGFLKKSLMKPRGINSGDRQVYVGSNLDYAIRQHENIHYRHKVGEAKFLQKGLEENKNKIIKVFQIMINEVIKDLKKLSGSL